MSFCSNCGKQLENGAAFCPNCGTNQNAAPQHAAPQYASAAPAPEVKESTWDGGVFDTFVHALAASLLISITCGIATPWAICYLWKYIVSHAIIDGKRLKFDGTGGQLFGKWLLWMLLTVITCGIYSFWVAPALYKWVASHTHAE